MTKIKWHTISKKTAEETFLRIFGEGQVINVKEETLPAEYQKLRRLLVDAYSKVSETARKDRYQIDLDFGLELYRLLGTEYDFSVSDAANSDFWYDLGLNIIPDIVYKRFASSKKSDCDDEPLNKDNVYDRKTHIWLRRIWWYIHLSWQGNAEETRRILAQNSTDTIMHLVDHVGKLGYRTDVCRTIMRKYFCMISEDPENNRKLFRSVMMRHAAWTATQEPALVLGGVNQYAESLFGNLKQKQGGLK